ncbi:MAG TPA: LLM class flavin-dependent oxidoreductase [Isosphaeraceae bacterium]|nr:LLM class flavin-dependent oxidoreductase [Isosphaeraceae bacterium]
MGSRIPAGNTGREQEVVSVSTPERVVGVAVHERTVSETLAVIRKADDFGVRAAWLTTGGVGPDGPTVLAAAAVQTRRIALGTAIVPTFPRHPLVVVQQAIVLAQLAPGRFRLGLGPSHRPSIEGMYGIPFLRPLEHLREYATIVRQALQGGTVDFTGRRFTVHARIPDPPGTPVFLSALRPASYELAGEIADGAISWVTPPAFLRDVARPALLAGAARRTDGRRPILVGHAFGVVSEDEAAVLREARERLAGYARLPFYQEMFAAAGYPEARQGTISDALARNLVIHGDEARFADGLRRFLDAGLDELIVSLLPVGADRTGSLERTLRALAS